MACRISLPFWPTSLNCLSWSKDNLIAVGGGDHVGILTPRLKEAGPNGTHWDSTVLKVNAFTAEEVPLLDPLSSENFSAGEELSLRHVQALEWSSPGLGRHQGCVLAILSSNHVFSIWACDGTPDLARNWKRSVIVNHALRKYYESKNLSSNGSQDDHHEAIQVSQRVRAFAWSVPIRKACDAADNNLSRYVNRGHQLLAVSTEGEDFLLLRVQSPHNILNPELAEWQIDVLHCFSTRSSTLKALHPSLSKEESGIDPSNHPRVIADHLAWGPWKENEVVGQCAPLAFIANGKLHCLQIDGNMNNVLPEAKVSSAEGVKTLVPWRSDLSGPLKCVPKTESLITFAADRVFCVSSFAKPTGESSVTFHHLDDRWDEISGVAFTESGTGLPFIHITSHLSSSIALTTVLSLPLDNDEISSKTLWQDSLNESKATFSAQYNLDDHVQERTWGIVASPLGEYVATATTLLPSDAVAYMTPSDYRTIVSISREAMVDHENILPLNGGTSCSFDVTAEVLLFGLQRYLDLQSVMSDCETLLQSMLKTVNVPADRYDFDDEVSRSYDDLSTVQVVRRLQLRVLMRPEMIKLRLGCLADIALGQASSAKQVSKQIISCLVNEVLRLPENLMQGGGLSTKIRKIYNLLQSKLSLEVQSRNVPNVGDWDEECRICHHGIPFSSVKWAKCGSGHQFSRCALTFLAIQEPGLSKTCTVCKTQFLDESELQEFAALGKTEAAEMTYLTNAGMQAPKASDNIEIENGTVQEEQSSGHQDLEPERLQISHIRKSTEPSTSLARTLFAAFDTCIYCGGKFVS